MQAYIGSLMAVIIIFIGINIAFGIIDLWMKKGIRDAIEAANDYMFLEEEPQITQLTDDDLKTIAGYVAQIMMESKK